jgi:hypothetical protein
MPLQKASRPATDLVNEPRAIDPAGELERREAIANPNAKQADSRRLVGSRWSRAVPDTALARAFLDALRRRAVPR